jgi:hypothetical protein
MNLFVMYWLRLNFEERVRFKHIHPNTEAHCNVSIRLCSLVRSIEAGLAK